VLKQALTPTCICGRAMDFKHGENKTFCRTPGCGVVLERGPEGYWAQGRSRLAFTPIMPKQKVCSVRSRADRYKNYPKSRRRGKAGTRC